MAVGGAGSGIGYSNLAQYDVQDDTAAVYAQAELDKTDGYLNRNELMEMFTDLGDDSAFNQEEIEALADYVLSLSDEEGKVTYDQVMEILDKDGDELIEFEDIETIQNEQDNIFIDNAQTAARAADGDGDNTDNEFELSAGDGSSTFKFTFLDEYEDELASIIDVNGSLSVSGLTDLLGGANTTPEEQAQKIKDDPMVQSVIAMGLMAVGLDEAEVTFIMNELVTTTVNPEFEVGDLLTIAGEASQAEEEELLSNEAEDIAAIFA